MSEPHCERCGTPLAAEPSQGRPHLCPPCRKAVADEARRRAHGRMAGVLGAALVACASGWIAWRIGALEARLARLEAAPVPVPETAPPFTPETAEALRRLAEGPERAAASEVAALRREVAQLREAQVGALASSPRQAPVPTAMLPAPMPPEPVIAPPPPAPAPPGAPPGLADADPRVRFRVLSELAREEDAAAAVPLLKDDLGFVRRAAAEALGRLQAADAVNPLVEMARAEPDDLARLAALKALGQITGTALSPAGPEEELRRCESWAAKRRKRP